MGIVRSWVVGLLIVGCCASSSVRGDQGEEYVSAVGDPGMRRDGLRVALEAWNFCNEVGEEAPGMGSPRVADCFDVEKASPSPSGEDEGKDEDDECGNATYKVVHKVTEADNKLRVGQPFDGVDPGKLHDVDAYAAEKEVYLGRRCEVREDHQRPWQFWMVMLKNGNMDTAAGLCPRDGRRAGPFPPERRFPCFGKGCMNQPLVYHNYTEVGRGAVMRGGFYGTWELDADVVGGSGDVSFYSVDWEKEVGGGGWKFHHVLRTSRKYPWLMLYLRSDATHGFSGGYHYPTRGMTTIVPESPNFKVRLTLDIKKGGGPKSQFYLMDMGSCWKNSGEPCDGDVTSDVTRYSEMIVNPDVEALCKPGDLTNCPPYHTFANGTRVHRSDARGYPHAAYHVHCVPGNAERPEEPFSVCDQYSNPQPQEIVQILPHPAWGEYGYPTRRGEGWVGDGRTWELDVGRMSQNLYFYQEPGTAPTKRRWPSLDVGTEIYVSDVDETAEWTVSDFDIIIPKSWHGSA